MLEYLDKQFIKSSFKVKIELYLLPLLILASIIYYLDYSNESKNINNTPRLNISTLKMKENILDITKKIETFSQENGIKLMFFKNENKSIYLKASSSYKKMKKFINFIENINSFSNIKSLQISRDERKYIVEIKIDFNKYFIKQLKTINENKVNKNVTFKIKAIVSDYVLINNRWLKEGEFIDKCKIKKIYNNEVLLFYKNKEILVKVFKNVKIN